MQSHIITREFVVSVIQTHLSIYIILSLSVHISMFIRLAEVCNGPYTVLNLLEYHARYPRIKYSCVYNVYTPSERNLGIDNVSLWAVVGYTAVHWWKAPRAGVCTPMSTRTVLFHSTAFFHLFSTSISAVNFELSRHFFEAHCKRTPRNYQHAKEIENIKNTATENVRTGVLDKNKEHDLRCRNKAEKHRM